MGFLETNRNRLTVPGRINGLGIRNAENLILHVQFLLQNCGRGQWILRRNNQEWENERENYAIQPNKKRPNHTQHYYS